MEIEILFEDENLLLINKPAGISSQAEKGNEDGIETILGRKPENFFIVHRLDRRVSGLLLIAKTKDIAAKLSAQFASSEIKKKYRAVVKQKPAEETGQLEHYLIQIEKLGKSFVSDSKNPKAKIAKLKYSILVSTTNYNLLDIEILTGRFHQIRCQLGAIGSPILGDLKYGFKRSSPDGSIFLQAYFITFYHPISKSLLEFELEIPEIWAKYGFSGS
jgi:23S rRNA pseudouridine1911/1915/1917 synthase